VPISGGGQQMSTVRMKLVYKMHLEAVIAVGEGGVLADARLSAGAFSPTESLGGHIALGRGERCVQSAYLVLRYFTCFAG
jgi:hypothetical protein